MNVQQRAVVSVFHSSLSNPLKAKGKTVIFHHSQVLVHWTEKVSGAQSATLLTLSCSNSHLTSHLCLSLSTSVSSFPVDGQNQCLKAAQDCGLFEKCGALRAEYVLACTKRAAGSDRCNRQKCHRALRRFLERVPEEYSFGVLFCSCTEPLCGERRRKTIVPSCSYEEKDAQPNCLHLESYCLRDDLCRWVYT